MKHLTLKIVYLALILSIILGVSTALWVHMIPDSQIEQRRHLPFFVRVYEPGHPITLEEVWTRAPFARMPTYLPEDLSLKRVTGFKGFSFEKDGLYDEIRLFYSDRPITILPYDPSAVNKYPAAAKLVIIVTRSISSPPNEGQLSDWIAGLNQNFGEEIFRLIKVRGAIGYGIDLGHVNRYEGWEEAIPASVNWWEKGLKFEVRGMFPLSELIKIAESMVDITSLSPIS